MGHLSKFLAAALVVGAQANTTAAETVTVASVFTSTITGKVEIGGATVSTTANHTECGTPEVAASPGPAADAIQNPTVWASNCPAENKALEAAVCNFLSAASGQSGLFTCDSATASQILAPEAVSEEQVAMVAAFVDETDGTSAVTDGSGTYKVSYTFTLKDTSAAAAGDKAMAVVAGITAAGTAHADGGESNPAGMKTLLAAVTASTDQTGGTAGGASAWLLTGTSVTATDATIDHVKEVETTTTGTTDATTLASTTVYNWQAYSSTLAGSVDLKSDISGITGCEDATKMMGDTAACVTLRGEIGTGICNGFASLLNTATNTSANENVYTTEVHTANNKYWRCTGDRSHFAITGIADKAARRLEEDKFLGDKRRLAAATHTYSYGVTKWHSATTGSTPKTAKENAEAESKIDMDHLNAALETASKEATLDVVGNAIFAVSYTAVGTATWACDGTSGDAASAQTCVADMSAVTATQAARPSEKSAMRTMSLGAMTAVILFFASLY